MKKLKALTVLLLLPLSFAAATPHAFPVPYSAKNPSHTTITFTDLPSSGSIRIFTIDGRQVIELNIPPGAGILDWAVVNSKGEKVTTGVYLFLVEGDGAKTEGKLVIIR